MLASNYRINTVQVFLGVVFNLDSARTLSALDDPYLRAQSALLLLNCGFDVRLERDFPRFPGRRSSATSRTTIGTSVIPAILAARQRRSPATNWNRSPDLRTTRGWMMPLARMDWANSESLSLWNMRRGWCGLGSISSSGMLPEMGR